MNKNSLIFLLILLILGFFLYFSAKNSYNGMVVKKENVEAKWAQVENQYQRRGDLIPNLINTVKGYQDFEQSTLQQVANARAKVGQLTVTKEVLEDPKLMERFSESQNQLSQALSRLLSVAENYPDLKASAQFSDLMRQLEGTENRISVARKDYNEVARRYNSHIKKFPTQSFCRNLWLWGCELLPGSPRCRKKFPK